MASWRRGSTPTNTFTVNVDLRDATVFVTYYQSGKVLVEKTGEDLSITSSTVELTLTQEDTLKFGTGEVSVQLRYVMQDGTADASNIITVSSERILKDGEITYV